MTIQEQRDQLKYEIQQMMRVQKAFDSGLFTVTVDDIPIDGKAFLAKIVQALAVEVREAVEQGVITNDECRTWTVEAQQEADQMVADFNNEYPNGISDPWETGSEAWKQ